MAKRPIKIVPSERKEPFLMVGVDLTTYELIEEWITPNLEKDTLETD